MPNDESRPECYNCKRPYTEATLIRCEEKGCEWRLEICSDCARTRMGDGSQAAVIEARAHSATHKPYMIVRLHHDSDTKGFDIGHAANEDELKEIIRSDNSQYPGHDYLVVEKASKRNVRINLRMAR